MGNWTILVEGTGPHHNKKPEIDADLKAKQLVKELLDMGQKIHYTSFTSGGREDNTPL